jgi:peptidase E
MSERKPRQLIVLGGGGFSMEASPLLDRYILDATSAARPKICFIGTASGDADSYLLNFYRSHSAYDCRASHLSLIRPPQADLAALLLEQDAIFVGGGNTRSMLALWREWSLDQSLRQAYEAGVVISGVSAGMICWFEQCLTDSNPGRLSVINGLGWLSGGACPHYDGEAARRPSLHAIIAEQTMAASVAADDGTALHYIDETLSCSVSSRPAARAWHIERTTSGEITEAALPTRYLG